MEERGKSSGQESESNPVRMPDSGSKTLAGEGGVEMGTGTGFKNSSVSCPHCGNDIAASMTLTVAKLEEQFDGGDGSPEAAFAHWKTRLDPESIEVVNMAEKSGLIEPFAKTTFEVHGQVVKMPARAFLAWVRTAKMKIIPGFAIEYFANEFGGRIQFISAQGIGCVITDGVLKMFTPDRVVCGSSQRAGSVRLRTNDATINQVMNWTRTKYGYVAGKGALFQSLQKRSYGDFARPGL